MQYTKITKYRAATGTVCDLEIHVRNTVPTVILSERSDNRGLSLTNGIEVVTAEIQRRFLSERDGGLPPFHVIHRNLFDQLYLVTFEHYDIMQRAFGRPTWHRCENERLSELLLSLRIDEIASLLPSVRPPAL